MVVKIHLNTSKVLLYSIFLKENTQLNERNLKNNEN
jgi:hypothetical protein